jgi:membrane-bound lytic murein transglycosylase B
MLSKGISEKTIQKAYGDKTYYHVRPAVVERDKKQAEFILTSTAYLNRLVSSSRVDNARKHYKELQKKYTPLVEKYGVPLNYLTAFWAVETNFGQNKGQYNLIDSLTNLSYKNRRADFFKKELYNVLQIMDRYDLENEKIMGSWAGAMGHFQFMPSTYNAYAVDYDGDGVIDIWDSFDDAVGSAANYLNSLGWKADQPWGGRVVLPWNFDYRLTGSKITKTVEEWNKLGVRTFEGKKLPYSPELKASVIMPDGRKGAIYLTLGNFRRIMIWNRSENYALAIGQLADYIVSNKKYAPLVAEMHYALTDQDIQKVQKFANRVLKLNLKVDGKLGPKTKEAVRKLQAKAKMTQDGYPDYRLLNKINSYDPKIGFAVPVQPVRKKK